MPWTILQLLLGSQQVVMPIFRNGLERIVTLRLAVLSRLLYLARGSSDPLDFRDCLQERPIKEIQKAAKLHRSFWGTLVLSKRTIMRPFNKLLVMFPSLGADAAVVPIGDSGPNGPSDAEASTYVWLILATVLEVVLMILSRQQ